MIFITIGTQAPFDRLIKTIDGVAKQFPNDSFIAQTLNGCYEPSSLTTVDFLTPRDFDDLFNDADLVISHAGMGTIISALTRNKPLLVMPRQATLSEHRNDHQLATAKKFQELNCIHVAQNELELSSTLTKMLDDKIFNVLGKTDAWASKELISSLKKDIAEFSNPKKRSFTFLYKTLFNT